MSLSSCRSASSAVSAPAARRAASSRSARFSRSSAPVRFRSRAALAASCSSGDEHSSVSLVKTCTYQHFLLNYFILIDRKASTAEWKGLPCEASLENCSKVTKDVALPMTQWLVSLKSYPIQLIILMFSCNI